MKHKNSMSVAIILLFAFAVAILIYIKPWETEVWINTTPDAFVKSVNINNDHDVANEIYLLSITPAPWPKEAEVIMKAAKRGRLVHVNMVSNAGEVKFDIRGISADERLIVDIASISDVQKFTVSLQINAK
jgi:hypothetical protein